MHVCMYSSKLPLNPYYRDARNMARDVHSILFKILREQGGMNDEEASSYIKKMQSRNRYLQDVWS